jgi:ABC-type branched-subunit amino acid transport system substrate-binding protein
MSDARSPRESCSITIGISERTTQAELQIDLAQRFVESRLVPVGGVTVSPFSEVGAPLPVTGRYSVQGAQVRAGLELWARHRATRLTLLDDGSNPQHAARIHKQLVARGCPLVVGPYGSDSTRAVARVAAGGVVWNHAAAADDVQRLPGVVSLASPASRYLVALGRAVAQLRPGAGVAIASAAGRFSDFAAEGLKQHAAVLGLGLVDKVDEADALLACGPLSWEIDLFQRIGKRRLLLGGCSPALAAFPQLLGDDPEGLLAPVQWHPDLRTQPELGPAIVKLDDYLAAQAYAACLIAERCLELDPDQPLVAAHRLRTTTFFGSFKLNKDGLQIDHRLSVIQWRQGRRQLVVADAA